jgi:hypothetical protein
MYRGGRGIKGLGIGDWGRERKRKGLRDKKNGSPEFLVGCVHRDRDF